MVSEAELIVFLPHAVGPRLLVMVASSLKQLTLELESAYFFPLSHLLA